MAISGDRCKFCMNGKYCTRTSKKCGDHQVRYLKCNRCGSQARSVIPADRSWRRQEKVV